MDHEVLNLRRVTDESKETFYACPTGMNGDFNVYSMPIAGQDGTHTDEKSPPSHLKHGLTLTPIRMQVASLSGWWQTTANPVQHPRARHRHPQHPQHHQKRALLS